MSSTIPAAIDALIAQIEAVADAGTKVIDGFPRFKIVNTDLIAVGGTAEPTATGQQVPEDEARAGPRRTRCRSARRARAASRRRRRWCATAPSSSWASSTPQSSWTPSLGGVVYLAELGGPVDLFQTEAESATSGTHAEVAFSVQVQAGV